MLMLSLVLAISTWAGEPMEEDPPQRETVGLDFTLPELFEYRLHVGQRGKWSGSQKMVFHVAGAEEADIDEMCALIDASLRTAMERVYLREH